MEKCIKFNYKCLELLLLHFLKLKLEFKVQIKMKSHEPKNIMLSLVTHNPLLK